MILAKTQDEERATRLYHYPGTRALRARWMLEELNIPYELSLVDLSGGAHKRDDYLSVHPLGKVPALRVDGTVLFESLAICLYLADRIWESDLAPVPEKRARRADYYKWMAYSVATLEPAIHELSRQRKAKEKGVEPINLGPALTPFETAAGYLDTTLGAQPYLMGDQFTAADLMNGAVMTSADRAGHLGSFPNINAWIARLSRRPAYLRASSDALGGNK